MMIRKSNTLRFLALVGLVITAQPALQFAWPSGQTTAVAMTVVADDATADDADTPDQPNSNANPKISFAKQILPILSDKCFACHGPDTADDGLLRLDSYEAATVDLGGYRAIDPERSDASQLIARIFSDDDPMPPRDADKQLDQAQRELLAEWVKQGGKYETHWAFVPPTKADLGTLSAAEAQVEQAIDFFIHKQLSSQGFDFAASADKATLARRVALVLTGLPPTLEQLDRFMNAGDELAYSNLIDELLRSPRFGEHQARFWLDAVRYGDTHGLHLDNKRGIYPYRDWVVRAFNQNLPVDQFITWQVAGDLLPEPTLEQLTATGFVRMNPSTGEGGAIAEEFQAKNNFDRTETFGTVLLGLSMVCARCHTHKYDPIPHHEYYQLMAFFNSTAEPALDGNSYTYGDTVKVPCDQDQWDHWADIEKQRNELLDALEKKLSATASTGAPISGAPWSELTAQQRLQRIADGDPLFESPEIEKAQAIVDFQKEIEHTFTTTLVARDLPTPRQTRVLRRGEYDMPTGEPVQPGVPSVLGALAEDAPRNRLGLARWLTARENPLVARVLVNRIWQQVFGHGLVRTPEDFGLQGEHPTHPELLDWLAVELQDSGWDLKHILRLMVSSRTFQQSSAWRTDIGDPDNRMWARGPSFRLDAEVIRDLGLWASDLLDPHLGGEGVKPYQPAGMWEALAHPASNTKAYSNDTGKLLYRRSLYVYWKRTSPHPMMTLFDAPDRESSCVRRSRTNTSLQSLGLFNETQRVEIGRKLAERLLHQAPDHERRLELLFKLLACRLPSEHERAVCMRLWEQLHQRYTASEADALALLATGDAPREEHLDAAQTAAWTQVAMTVLASDIALTLY